MENLEFKITELQKHLRDLQSHLKQEDPLPQVCGLYKLLKKSLHECVNETDTNKRNILINATYNWYLKSMPKLKDDYYCSRGSIRIINDTKVIIL